jgi:rubrerythrin
MVKCTKPGCGAEIEKPTKEWDMQPKSGRGPALHVKHYKCPVCGHTFRMADKLPPSSVPIGNAP